MHTPEPITVKTLVIEDVTQLDIRPAAGKRHHPSNIILQNIKFIPKLPSATISDNATEEVEFKNVKIGTMLKVGALPSVSIH